jgi:hypothetical protein
VNICERDPKNDKKEEIPRGCNLWNFNVLLVETTFAPASRYAVAFSAQLKLKKMRNAISRWLLRSYTLVATLSHFLLS